MCQWFYIKKIQKLCPMAILIASHNNFREGVAYLKEKQTGNCVSASCLSTESEIYSKLEPLKFPPSLELLLAAIYCAADAKELKVIIDGCYICDLGVEIFCKALVHAVSLKKHGHVNYLKEHKLIRRSLESKEINLFIREAIKYSCQKFEYAFPFFNFLINSMAQIEDNQKIAFDFIQGFMDLQLHENLIQFYCIFPQHLRYYFRTIIGATFEWKVSPEFLFILLKECGYIALPFISNSSLRAFALTPYSRRNTGSIFGLSRLPECPFLNSPESNERQDTFLAIFIKLYYTSFDVNFLLQKIPSECKAALKQSLLAFFIVEDQELYNVLLNSL